MPDRTHLIAGLEGTTVFNYGSLADELPDREQQKTFLTDVGLIANTNPNGVTNRIDPGDEAIALAHLLIQDFPQLNHQSITATDVADYLVQMVTRGPLLVELAARTLAREIQRDPTQRQISFQEKTYEIGQDDINAIINGALEKAGSSMRFFLWGKKGRPAILLFGKMSKEEEVTAGKQKVHIVFMGTPEIQANLPSFLGLNDEVGLVVILEGTIQTALDTMIAKRPYALNYQRGLHEAIYREFLGAARTNREKTLGVIGRLVKYHEVAHILLQQAFGHEHKFVAELLFGQGDPTLAVLEELYPDIFAVEGIVQTAKQDPQAALEAYHIWSIVRTPTGKREVWGVSDQSISNLLLSAGRIERGNVVVNWPTLEARVAAFKGLFCRESSQTSTHILVSVSSHTEGVKQARRE